MILTILEDLELDEAQIYDWYNRAMRGQINIFDNQNKIIALLARELLKMRGIDVKTYTKN